MPVEIGRRTLLTMMILLVVAYVTSALAVRLDFALTEWLWGLLVATILALAPLLVIMPAVLFLIHSARHRDQGITARLRYSATATAIAPAVAGLMLIRSASLFGWILVCLAAVIVARAWTWRGANATEGGATMSYTNSLAGLAIVVVVALDPPHVHTKRDNYLFAMKYDLRHLVSAQKDYFKDHKRYTTDLAALGFRHSTGVNDPIVVVGPDWWSATNTHSQLSKTICGIAVNTTNPVVASARSGEAACK